MPDFLRCIRSDFGAREAARGIAMPNFWHQLLQGSGQNVFSCKPADLDISRLMHSELWRYLSPKQSGKPIFGLPLQSEAAKDQTAGESQNSDPGGSFQWNPGGHIASRPGKPVALVDSLGPWLVVVWNLGDIMDTEVWQSICTRGFSDSKPPTQTISAPLRLTGSHSGGEDPGPCGQGDTDQPTAAPTKDLWIHVQPENAPSRPARQSLHFGVHFNQDLREVRFPRSLQKLTVGGMFNSTLCGKVFPDDLKSLTFGCHFNRSIAELEFPRGLQTLTFGEHFDQSLDGVQFPQDLQSLRFGQHFNQPLQNLTLPSSLESISFGRVFNQSLEQMLLPSNLRNLEFGSCFNQMISSLKLPNSLQSLTFGDSFNQSLENVNLPASLQTLAFGKAFDQSLEKVTRLSPVHSLSLSCRTDFDHFRLGHRLASNVSCNCVFRHDEWNSHSNCVLSISEVKLPECLRHLTFGQHFNQSLDLVQSLSFTFPQKMGHWNRYFNGTWSFKNKKSKVQTSQIPSNLSNNPEHHRLKRCWFWSCWAYDLVRWVCFFLLKDPHWLSESRWFTWLAPPGFDMFIKQQYSYIIRIYIYIHHMNHMLYTHDYMIYYCYIL